MRGSILEYLISVSFFFQFLISIFSPKISWNFLLATFDENVITHYNDFLKILKYPFGYKYHINQPSGLNRRKNSL